MRRHHTHTLLRGWGSDNSMYFSLSRARARALLSLPLSVGACRACPLYCMQRVCVCMYVCMCVCTYVCIYTARHVGMYISFICICMFVCIHTHTHKHTLTCSATPTSRSMAVLVHDFFHYFSRRFDWNRHVVSVTSGGLLLKSQVSFHQGQHTFLCIQDPLDLVARHTHIYI
jgi:hypothetical protein